VTLILIGALLVAVGVGLYSLPAGVIVLGLVVIGAGVYQDLTTPDEDGDA
jgi:hypothetical protein